MSQYNKEVTMVSPDGKRSKVMESAFRNVYAARGYRLEDHAPVAVEDVNPNTEASDAEGDGSGAGADGGSDDKQAAAGAKSTPSLSKAPGLTRNQPE